jgi:hypothetical protein
MTRAGRLAKCVKDLAGAPFPRKKICSPWCHERNERVKGTMAKPDKFLNIGPLTPTSKRPPGVSLRCPHCRQLGTFQKVGDQNGLEYYRTAGGGPKETADATGASIRLCPNLACNGLVFVLVSQQSPRMALTTLSPELIDFDASHLPPACLTTLQEAVACHGVGAYRAAAMMVRRLLEEVCANNNARGVNLHQRLESLKTMIILPQALFDALEN